MERTELREQFFAETQRDPYTRMILHYVANAWADGYEQALRDNGLTEQKLRKSHTERVNDAVEHLTEQSKQAQAQAIIAMAAVGPLIGVPKGV
jgi:hypothetical protein